MRLAWGISCLQVESGEEALNPKMKEQNRNPQLPPAFRNHWTYRSTPCLRAVRGCQPVSSINLFAERTFMGTSKPLEGLKVSLGLFPKISPSISMISRMEWLSPVE